jgi:hypothetical protein
VLRHPDAASPLVPSAKGLNSIERATFFAALKGMPALTADTLRAAPLIFCCGSTRGRASPNTVVVGRGVVGADTRDVGIARA